MRREWKPPPGVLGGMAHEAGHRSSSHQLSSCGDERLAALVRKGDAAAFEVLYARHQGALLAFCRKMLGSHEDGEDALQQTFVRAHRALRAGQVPEAVRPWLFAIARNRCRTIIAARRAPCAQVDELELGADGLAEDVRCRAALRELIGDLACLPQDQRGALLLAELSDRSHVEIAAAVGCPPGKVKALLFQAREALIAEREAREVACAEIQGQLEVARGGALRRGLLRRHLRQCDDCRTHRDAVARPRTRFALSLPVAPRPA